ncbi:unnamed protein product [Microthlaspi erraticum]|uniref:Uncharacterized protein n=1 Tax=Microthlaspi erraticum TaxID=1685480 RepID=A0A6D2IRY0_9BRAS|nr:unnamed protein product [Microthlaspi erraticum]
MGNEELAPENTSPCDVKKLLIVFLVIAGMVAIVVFGVVELDKEVDRIYKKAENYVPEITIPSTDFNVLNVTESRLDVKWDLLIRLPSDLPGYYMCLKGDFQVFMLYKDIMEDVKQSGEIRFGSRFILPDCRKWTKPNMNYTCDEATLRFEPGSQRKAISFGKQPTCRYVR